MRFFLAVLVVSLYAVSAPVRAQSIACLGGEAGGYACEAVDLLAHLPRSTFDASRNNDLWGWTDPDTDRLYALVGLTNGLAFVDVTAPEAPIYLGKLPTHTESSTWRDVKTYANHAFVVADGAGSHGMQVFDLTRLRDVPNPPQTFTADARYTGFGSAHNVVINEDSGFAYAVGGDCSGGLHMVDIRDPLNPAEAGCFSADGYTHDAQCVTYTGPDADYTGREICMAANEDNVAIVDVTDKANPALIAHAEYPFPGYTHQGWFTEDQRYFIVDDEIDDFESNTTRTIVLDVEDLDSPEFAFFYLGALETTDHNLYVRGTYAYLSNYEGGLRILDLSGIDDGVISEVAHFDTYPSGNNESYNGQWSNYPFFENGPLLANDRDEGLFVLDFAPLASASEPAAPMPSRAVLSGSTPNPARGFATLTLTVDTPQRITAEVFDLAGRRVATLYEGSVGTAPHTLTLDGAALPSGLYLVQVRGEHFFATRRVSLVR